MILTSVHKHILGMATLVRNNMLLYSQQDALNLLEYLKLKKIGILAVDGFDINEKYISYDSYASTMDLYGIDRMMNRNEKARSSIELVKNMIGENELKDKFFEFDFEFDEYSIILNNHQKVITEIATIEICEKLLFSKDDSQILISYLKTHMIGIYAVDVFDITSNMAIFESRFSADKIYQNFINKEVPLQDLNLQSVEYLSSSINSYSSGDKYFEFDFEFMT